MSVGETSDIIGSGTRDLPACSIVPQLTTLKLKLIYDRQSIGQSIYDRQSIGQSVFGVRHPSWTRDQFFFLLEIYFKQLRVYYFVAPSLTRGRVCNLQYNCFWVLPEQSLLGRSPAELTTIFYCLIWDSPNLEGQVPVFISPRHWVPFLSPLTTRRATVEIF
jgi:hypothetical protein